MGQKVNPIGFRLGVIKDWQAHWYSGRGYAVNLIQDLKVRDYLRSKLANAAVSKVSIERARQEIVATVHTARPGIVIGKKGEDIEKMRRELSKMVGHRVDVKITEIRKPEVDGNLVAESIAQQLEKRVMFRKAMRRSVQNAMRLGAKGIKVMVAGRLNGAEIARTEWYREGRVPLHTLRADIDYGHAIARTTYGVIGVKVWIFRGEVFGRDEAVAGAGEAA
jgi:small subunit ribosomal protein S3